MGHDLSRIVDTLYPLSTNQRLETLNQLLQDQDVSVDSAQNRSNLLTRAKALQEAG